MQLGYGPGANNGKQDMLDQLRAKRRKRKAKLLAFSILATAGLLLVVVLVMFLRSCFAPPPGERIAVGELPEDIETTASQQAGEIDFRPAPLYVSLGSEYLVTAVASPGRDEQSSGREVEKITAYRIDDGRLAWERPVNDLLAGLLVSGGHAIVHRMDDRGFSARAFSLEDGSPAWEFAIEGAQNLSLTNDDARMALAYSLVDGFRIAIYDTVNGVKSSGQMLRGADNLNVDFSRMSMRFLDEQLLYTVDRTVGMMDTGGGGQWAETGSAQVITVSPDMANRQLYVLSMGNGGNSLVLHMRDFADGGGKELDRFETIADSLVMVADDGYLLLGFSDGRDDGHYNSSVRLFRKDSRDSYVRETLEGVRIEDAMPLGSGLFVIGVNRSTGNPDNPVKGGELHLVNADDGSVKRFEQLREKIEYTVRFGDDRLVLLDGGEIQRIDMGSVRAERVRRAAHPVLVPAFSPDGSVFGVFGYPRTSTGGEPADRMQALIFR